MVFPEAAAAEVEAEADELEALSTARSAAQEGQPRCSACGRQAQGRGVEARTQSSTGGGAAGSSDGSSSSSSSTRLGGRRVLLSLHLRRQKPALSECGSSPQATAGRRHQQQWHGGRGGGRAGGRGSRRSSCVGGGPQ
jgi:hypothetical protein